MKQVVTILLLAFLALSSNAQNVGVGTTTPIEKLDVNGNVNVGGTIKANGIAGNVGQVLSTTGTGLAWVNGIYTLNSTNFSSITVPSNNYVRIQDTLTLTNDYSGLNNSNLFIVGGVIKGNGISKLNVGNGGTTFSGTFFNSVDIFAPTGTTFINCTFFGTCPNLGFGCTFISCQIVQDTTTSSNTVGLMDNCYISNSSIPSVGVLRNCGIINCTLGNGGDLFSIINCRIINSTIYALIDNLTFTNNDMKNSKLFIGNPTKSPSMVTIANNKFSGLFSGTTEVIEVSPLCGINKNFSIQGNIFSMLTTDSSSIKISGNDGYIPGYSFTTIQNNVFQGGKKTLNYSGNMKVCFSNNTSINATGTGATPTSSGNLLVAGDIRL